MTDYPDTIPPQPREPEKPAGPKKSVFGPVLVGAMSVNIVLTLWAIAAASDDQQRVLRAFADVRHAVQFTCGRPAP